MAKTYKGTSGADNVNQTNNNNYYNILTYGGADIINLTLTSTWVKAAGGDDTVNSDVEGGNKIALGSGDDTYLGEGFAKNGRHDEIFGGAGNDTMTVFTRQSDYHGDGGNDFISSAGYWNLLIGGKGNDTVSYMAQDDDKYLEGFGVGLDLGRGIAKTGEGRKERVVQFENAEGTSYGDSIIGSKRNNELYGMDGSDELSGMKGNDKLFGGDGKDFLYGGVGRDELTGGKGADQMWGGSGKDTFIFADVNEMGTGQDRDNIKDFENGDKIDLSGVGMTDYIGGAAFSNTAGELRFEDNILYGDVDGNGTADFEIKVTDVKSLQDSDFIL